MPIITYEDGGMGIEYNLPQELKDLITKEFATTMIKEIEKVWPDTAEDIGYMVNTLYTFAGTSGIHTAFRNTCDILGLIKFKEASKLDWYDYDLFIDQILNTVGEVFFGKENYKGLCDKFIEIWNAEAEEAERIMIAEEAADKTNILSEKEE